MSQAPACGRAMPRWSAAGQITGHDNLAQFAPTMAPLDRLGDAVIVQQFRIGKQPLNVLEKSGLIGLDAQQIVPTGREDGRAERGLAMHRVPSQHPAHPVDLRDQRERHAGFTRSRCCGHRLLGENDPANVVNQADRMDGRTTRRGQG
jgi:hypothetical protein